MTSKILRHTGDHIPRSTLLPLKDWEITDPDQIEQRIKFDRLVHDALGKPEVENDFLWEFLTPINESYENNDDVLEGSADFEPLPDPDPLPTPEASENYVNDNVMLPLGDSLSRGKVVERKCDAKGNVMGCSNDNPIRDTRQYVVKFDSGEVTELTANVISQSMYRMCDKDGYQGSSILCHSAQQSYDKLW